MFLNVKRARRFSQYQLQTAGVGALTLLAKELGVTSIAHMDSIEELARMVHEKLNELPDATDRLDMYAIVIRDIATSIECMNRMLFLLKSDPDAFSHEQLALFSASTHDMVGGSTELLKVTEKIINDFGQGLQPT